MAKRDYPLTAKYNRFFRLASIACRNTEVEFDLYAPAQHAYKGLTGGEALKAYVADTFGVPVDTATANLVMYEYVD